MDDSKRLETSSVTTKTAAAKQAVQSAKNGKETGARPSVNIGRPSTR